MLHDTSIIAHRTEGGEEQSLYDHVEGVALQIRRNLTEAGLKQLIPLGELLGRLHDAGKAQPAFYKTENEMRTTGGTYEKDRQ